MVSKQTKNIGTFWALGTLLFAVDLLVHFSGKDDRLPRTTSPFCPREWDKKTTAMCHESYGVKVVNVNSNKVKVNLRWYIKQCGGVHFAANSVYASAS